MSHMINDDIVIACADLVERSGAAGFEIGHVHDDVPADQAGWYAHAEYRGARLIAQDHDSPTTAALALAQRLLAGATCRCGHTVSLSDSQPGCRWQLRGRRWEPGCDAPPVRIPAARGDLAAMAQHLADQPTNRAARRADKRRRHG